MPVPCFKKSSIVPGTTTQCSGDHMEDYHDTLEYLVLSLSAKAELYRNQAREAVLLYQEERAKVHAVHLAWNRPGPRPDIHKQEQDNLARKWPVLAMALRQLKIN